MFENGNTQETSRYNNSVNKARVHIRNGNPLDIRLTKATSKPNKQKTHLDMKREIRKFQRQWNAE